jgi:hypothetical protein
VRALFDSGAGLPDGSGSAPAIDCGPSPCIADLAQTILLRCSATILIPYRRQSRALQLRGFRLYFAPGVKAGAGLASGQKDSLDFVPRQACQPDR